MRSRPLGLQLSRRDVLRTALGAVGLVTLGGLVGDDTPSPPTFGSLLEGRPFYVAHRGGGGDWPEMTAYAYDQASRLPGLQALEVSLCLSRDGVLVCSHDPTTTRVTGVSRTIAAEPWSVLSRLRVSAAGTTDPNQPSQPLSRFEEVAGHASELVLFAEPKVEAASAPLLEALAALRQPGRTVLKSYVTNPTFAQAKARGFSTWAYVLDQPSHLGANLERFAADDAIDLLGVGVAESDELITSVVTAARRHGKQTMAYPLTTPAEVSRARALGCTGLMTSRIRELLPPAHRGPGELASTRLPAR